jgi:ABC-type molybdate transport system permease subunit
MLWLGRKSRLALIGVGLCVGAPLLALGPSVSGFMVAERYMYPSLLGLALWVGTTITINRYSMVLAAVLTSISIGVHAQRAGEWTNDAELFEAAMEDEPLSSYSWHFLGEVCQREGNWY